MRKIALDIGSRRIGVAQSDMLGIIATPTEVYTRRSLGLDAKYISDLAKKLEADTIVVGLPLKLDGSEGASVQMAREFAQELGRFTSAKIEFIDERFTTVSAERMLLESDMRRDKRRETIDMVAASIILQAYLDKKK